jgi:hypothetical protein
VSALIHTKISMNMQTYRERSVFNLEASFCSEFLLLQKQRRLFEYSAEGNVKQVKRLVGENVDLNVTDYDRRSPTHSARNLPQLEV